MSGGETIHQPNPQHKKPGAKFRIYILLIFACIAVALLTYVWSQRQTGFRWDLFLKTFSHIDWGWFGISIFLVTLTYIGRVIRWQVMMRPLRPHSSFANILKSTIIGFTAIVLFGRAGELVRPYLISIREKVPFSSQLAAWLLERIYDLISVLVLFGFALTRISSSSSKVGPNIQWILQAGGSLVGVLCTLCLAVLIAFGLFPEFVEKRLMAVIAVLPEGIQERVKNITQSFLSGTESTRRWSFVLQLVVYTFAEWLLITACFISLFRAFPAMSGLGFIDALIIVGFVAFGSAIQIPGVGGGMQVATVVILTELFEVPLEIASGMALLMWLVTFVVVVPFGLILAVHEGLEWRKLMDSKNLETAP